MLRQCNKRLTLISPQVTFLLIKSERRLSEFISFVSGVITTLISDFDILVSLLSLNRVVRIRLVSVSELSQFI